MKLKSVCILYGFGEGKYHGRALVRQLETAGFDVTDDDHSADIIVTHSAGSWMLPPNYHDKLLVFIGPVYWPGNPILWDFLRKICVDIADYAQHGQLIGWGIKTFWNVMYILRYVVLRPLAGAYEFRQDRFYEALSNANCVIVRAEHDAFLSPDGAALLSAKVGRPIPFEQLPGQHDSCWRDPAPYVEIVRRYTPS